MSHVEPMDLDCIDSDFDKENTYQHNNVLPRVGSTEKGYEELDVSDLNMKLRYSVTPAASPMSKSFTANCTDNKIFATVEESVNDSTANLTRSFNSTFTNSDSVLKSPKSLPLQCLSSENFKDLNRNSSIRRSLDAPKNNVTVTITSLQDIEDNLSLPSTSSSLAHTPEATTPTKDIPKQDGSPIMRGLKSVLSMFRTSQSPIPPADEPITERKDLSVTQSEIQLNDKQTVLASTPIRNKNSQSKSSSPLKESVAFKDDLERELQWKDDSTIIFKEEKIPIHKLFLPSLPLEVNNHNIKSTNNLATDNMHNTVEYMDISLNESALNEQLRNTQVIKSDAGVESDSEFQDCETTFSKTEQDLEQKTTDDIIKNCPEISPENINMSIVDNEYHEVKDHQSVSPFSDCVVKETSITQSPIDNNIPQVIQEVKRENESELGNVSEARGSEEKVSELILPDLVENTANEYDELDSKHINTSLNTLCLEDDDINKNQLVKDETLPISKDDKEQETNDYENRINVTSQAEVQLNNINSSIITNIENEKPQNETIEISLNPEKFHEEDVVPRLTLDHAIHEFENENAVSIIGPESVEAIKCNVNETDINNGNSIENTPIIQESCLEESQNNIKLIYDDLNDTSLPTTIITSDSVIRDSCFFINNVPTEMHMDTSNMMCCENVTNDTDNTVSTESTSDFTDNQHILTNAKVISPEYSAAIPLNESKYDSNSVNIEKGIESHNGIGLSSSDVPIPSENDDKTNECDLKLDKSLKVNIPQSCLPQVSDITADKDIPLKLYDAAHRTIVSANSGFDDQRLPLDDDTKIYSSIIEDPPHFFHKNKDTRDKPDVIAFEQVNVSEVKHSNKPDRINVLNNLTLCSNKNNIEHTLNINTDEITEERQCDMEVEDALLTNIEEATAMENVDDIIAMKNNNVLSDITVTKDEILAQNDIDIKCDKVKNDMNPVDTKCKILITPPASPKIVSRGYNFNFDEIDDPFATKTKIRESPTPLSPPDNTLFKPINDHGNRKPMTNKKPNQKKRKSQPVSNASSKIGLNATFDSSTFSKKSLDNLKSEKNKFESSKFVKQLNVEDVKVTQEVDGESKQWFNKNKENDEIPAEEGTYENDIIRNKEIDSDPSTTADVSVEISRKNVFNIPEIDDRNFNPFASRSKMCASPIFQNNSTIDTNTGNVSICDTTVNINNVEGEMDLVNNIEKESPSDLSNITLSSKHTDERNDTVKEILTEDEDTIEGPFLEPEDFVDFDHDTDILPAIEKNDVIGFDDFPPQSNNEENGDNAEIFIDAEAFEFLLNQNKSNVVADSGKESLFLKFDPLFAKRVSSDGILAALNNPPKRVSTPKKTRITNPDLPSDLFNAGPSSSTPVVSNYTEDVSITKPTMIVNPAVNSVSCPRKTATPPKVNRQSLTFTSPAMAVIDRLLSLSGNSSFLNHDTTVPPVTAEQHQTDIALSQLREMLAEKEINVQTLRSEREELKDRLAAMESQVKSLESDSADKLRKLTELNQTLSEKTKENKTMAAVVEEYERTIASLVAELEQDKRRNAEERMKLIRDRDEQTAHLASMEVSFSDLHSKYEKSKQIIFSLKANEDTYKKSVAEFEENLMKMQNNYELLKQHATSKLSHANSELEKMNRAHEADVLKLNAMIKRKDLHITSLEETLAQKTKANEELTAICDELINKVG